MISARDFLSWLWYAVEIKAGYIWGKCGILWTAKRQADLVKKYNSDPAGYSDYASGAKYGERWVGHIVFDCANLLRWAAKKCGYDTVHAGSNLIYDCDLKTRGALKNGQRTDGKPLLPGSPVFTGTAAKHPHVGVYVGNGQVIEAAGTLTGVVVSGIADKTSKGADKWTYFGEFKGVNLDVPEGEIVLPAESAENAPSGSSNDSGNDSPSQPTPAPNDPDNGEKPVLKKGDRGEWVTVAQTKLINKGYSCGSTGADGIFGKNTEAAVKQFQIDSGLLADGVVNAPTWAALDAEPVFYTVTIPGLSKIHAAALVANYPGATMEERGN